jgi:benzoylformate decarboxylase
MRLGRDVVYAYLRDLKVQYLFGVPGTNEIPLIDGTNVDENHVKYIPCMHENIAVGAAMGYARASGKPGVVELHVTPGAAHGIGNLFNAYKAHIPVVILCAQQHSTLLAQEPLLASDLVQVARQYTKWAYEVRFPAELPLVLQRAFKEALSPPMRPVFLSIPWDFTIAPVPLQAGETDDVHVTRVGRHYVGDAPTVERAARMLAEAKNPIIVVGDGTGAAGAWADMRELAELVGAPVYAEALQSYINFPNGPEEYHWLGELPQTQQRMQEVFAPHDVAFFCGYNAQAQVLVFDYAKGPMIPPGVRQIQLHDDPWEIGKNGFVEAAILGDIGVTLPVLRDAAASEQGEDAKKAAAARNAALKEGHRARRDALQNRIELLIARDPSELSTGVDIALELEKLKPKEPRLMLSNEAVSDVQAFETFLMYDGPEDYFFGVGGSLGFSMPAALGMKLAMRDARTVVNVVGDGSALFYPHTWWTAAKYELPILFVITNNREYKTLRMGLDALAAILGWKPTGDPDAATWYLKLHDPLMSFVAVAATFGIEGALVETVGDLPAGLQHGLEVVAGGNPFVLEVLTEPHADSAFSYSDLKEADSAGPDAGLDYFGPV